MCLFSYKMFPLGSDILQLHWQILTVPIIAPLRSQCHRQCRHGGSTLACCCISVEHQAFRSIYIRKSFKVQQSININHYQIWISILLSDSLEYPCWHVVLPLLESRAFKPNGGHLSRWCGLCETPSQQSIHTHHPGMTIKTCLMHTCEPGRCWGKGCCSPQVRGLQPSDRRCWSCVGVGECGLAETSPACVCTGELKQ